MYRTSKGNRTLSGAERALFVEALGMMADVLSHIDHVADIAVFDELQRGQKIAVLLGISRALLRDNVPPPPLTAINEAAVAAVFRFVQDRVVQEIEMPEWDQNSDAGTDWQAEDGEQALRTWRRLILDACREVTGLKDLPDADSTDKKEWEFLIETLQDQILWDTDWEMALPLDLDPEKAKTMKEIMGINEDYYVAVPPDPADEEVAEMLMQLRLLTPEGRGL